MTDTQRFVVHLNIPKQALDALVDSAKTETRATGDESERRTFIALSDDLLLQQTVMEVIRAEACEAAIEAVTNYVRATVDDLTTVIRGGKVFYENKVLRNTLAANKPTGE